MDKKALLMMVAVCALVLSSIQCKKEEQQRAKDRTENTLNNAFDATTDVLRNVASGINNAVYNK